MKEIIKKNSPNPMLSRQKTYLLIILIIVTFLSFWKIGQHDLQEWDESRNGVNAYEMLHNKDYVNYYYDNAIDTWSAKPPLMIWAIALSYKIFGFNEFALRFPSVISTIIFFIFCFLIIKTLEDSFKAFICCLILISSKAILGNHIGLTGDFDAMLLMFLTASVYYFILYVEKQKKYAIFLVALLTGLAFYTKGTASLVFIPGFIIYILFKKRGIVFFKDIRVWISFFIFLSIAASWILIVYSYGKHPKQTYYGTSDSVETMFIHDTYRRLASSNFGEIKKHDYLFFFKVIDSRLNIWNYFFYIGLLAGLYKLYLNRYRFFKFINSDSNRLVILSVFIVLPLSITLSLSYSPNNWYLAPIFMFVVYITVKSTLYICNKWKPLYLVLIGVFLFTFVRQINYIYTQPQNLHSLLNSNKNLQNQKIIVTSELKQNILLYLHWLQTSIYRTKNLNDVFQYKGQIILMNKNQVQDIRQNIDLLCYIDDFCLVRIKKISL